MTTNTVLHHLYQQSAQTPDKILYTFVDDAGRDQAALTCRQLVHAANGIAAALVHQHGLKRGDRVLLSYPQSLDFIEALAGCMAAGIIPVPVYPPNPLNPGGSVALFATLAAQCDARAVLTNGEYSRLRQLSAVKGFFTRTNQSWPDLPWIRTDQTSPSPTRPTPNPPIQPDDIAFLQFTSGSTSTPKGVAVTYANLDHQLNCNTREVGFHAASRSVFWVPQYHDFGLISGILNGMFGNGSWYMISPLSFVKRPAVWFEVMSRVQATHTAAPNFAYELAVRKTTEAERQRWDLRSLEIVMSAAEPIQPATVERFFAAFAPTGLRREAFCPAYGLAEHTVGVSVRGTKTIRVARRELEQGQVRPISDNNGAVSEMASTQLIGCGYISDGVTVRIVDPKSRRLCPPMQVGEIWVDSPSKAAGYFGLEEETQATFHAKIAGEDDTHTYLRTGDLGFLYEGELFIAGRHKDMIIAQGRNLYPQDIEETVRTAHPLIRPGGIAAFAVPGDGAGSDNGSHEQLAIMVEVRGERIAAEECQSVVESIQQQVFNTHQLACHAVLLCQKGAIFKTTSGKVQRNLCRQAYLTGSLGTQLLHAAVAEAPPSINSVRRDTEPQSMRLRQQLVDANATERQSLILVHLQFIAARVLGLSSPAQIDPRQGLPAMGLDSLKSIELITLIETELQLTLPMTAFLDSSLEQLAAQLAAQLTQTQKMPEDGANGTDATSPAEGAHGAVARQISVTPAPTEREAPFPLTDVQHAYWIGRSDVLDLGQVATHGYIELAYRDLDVPRLNQALQRLIARHEMLRATLLPDGQQQILSQTPTYEIGVLDLSTEQEAEQSAQLAAIRAEMSHQRLPADQWPLFDIRISRLSPQQMRLHISVDILMFDLGSLQILAREWQLFYEDPARELPALDLSFRDYVLAEAKLAETTLYQKARAYWINRLDTLPAAPALPLAPLPDGDDSLRFTRRSERLDSQSWQHLKSRAAQLGVSPSALLLTAFAAVLNTWSKEPAFTINLTLFNRLPLHPQVNDIVGDFTSINLLAVDHRAPLPFGERVQQLQRQLWQDLEHRYFSGIKVIRQLLRRQKHTNGGLMPIVFTSALGLAEQGEHAAAQDPFRLLGGELVYGISQTPQVWLDHQVMEQDGALVFNWDAVEARFPRGMLDDMFAAYCRLLHQLVTDDAAWQAPSLSLAPPAHVERVANYNATAAPISDELLHTLFLQQAESCANRPAVITAQHTFTYGEIYTLAHQLAHQIDAELPQHSATAAVPLVAVVMEKGWEQVVAVLAIHLAGAAYVPVDPNLPTERQRYLLSHSEATLILTQPKLDASLAWPTDIERLCVHEQMVDGPTAPLPVIRQPTDLAYIIYTSGSTGFPKGVAIDHRGAVNTVLDINRRFDVTAHDRVLALSALSFDLSVYDIFGPLAIGGAIVMPDAARQTDPMHWLECIRAHKVTIWNSVPALMQMLIDYQEAGPPAGAPQTTTNPTRNTNALRLVMLSGDWIPIGLPDRIQARWEDARVISLGGATEASIWSIYYPIERVDPSWNSIPYGYPLTNQTFHVLDAELNPCPLWVTGDLYIGGIGLAQSYWRDEEKTNSSFILRPQAEQDHAPLGPVPRLYKTGDLGRYRPTDQPGVHDPGVYIEFLGREDFQVKVRGHRIELGEIEATLQQHPHVATAVVEAVDAAHGAKQLVAYIVRSESETTGSGGIPDALATVAEENILLDATERLAFKLKQPGIRHFDTAMADNGARSRVSLPKLSFASARKREYLARQSYRRFTTEPVSLDALNALLSALHPMPMADMPLPKYRYPSAGSLYPVQTYLHIKEKCVAGVAGGYYYYHPLDHELICISTNSAGLPGEHTSVNQPIFDAGAFALFLVADLDAIAPLYGSLARDFCLLEAGYMSQLLMTEAPEHHLGLCPIGALDDGLLRQRFNLSPNHQLLHSLVGGGIEADQRLQWTIEPQQPASMNWQAEMQSYAAEKLPEYMVPTTYVELETLPLTTNGKVDRQALRSTYLRAESDTEQRAVFIAPRTPLEEQLAEIWCEILERTQISVDENFFELGGDSLLVTQLLARLRATYEIEFPLRSLFDYPTVATFAEYIETFSSVQALLPVDVAREEEEEGRI